MVENLSSWFFIINTTETMDDDDGQLVQTIMPLASSGPSVCFFYILSFIF